MKANNFLILGVINVIIAIAAAILFIYEWRTEPFSKQLIIRFSVQAMLFIAVILGAISNFLNYKNKIHSAK